MIIVAPVNSLSSTESATIDDVANVIKEILLRNKNAIRG